MKVGIFAAAVFVASALIADAGELSTGNTLESTQALAKEKFNGDTLVISYTSPEAKASANELLADEQLRKFVASNFAVYFLNGATPRGTDELNSLGAQGGGDRLVVVADRLNNLRSHRALIATTPKVFLSYLRLVKSSSTHEELVAGMKSLGRAPN